MKILVVEDHIKLARAIAQALETKRHVVDVANDGLVGYDLADTAEYDLIILDIMLPSMDGIEIAGKLRENKNATPILMLTAKGQISDRVAGLDVGADDYLVKPFSFEELFARIRALSRRSRSDYEPVLKLDNLSLDLHEMKAKRGPARLDLSAKEFAILEYLLRNKYRVMSKEQIVRHVWDYDTDVLPSTVEVHIKNLREKVDAPFDKKLIHTVRGFGYELRDPQKKDT